MTGETIDGIRLEEGETIDWIVLDRPGKANAFSAAMLERFTAVLRERRETGAPILGIRGAGSGFGAGMDLGEYNAAASVMDDALRLSSYVERWMDIWRHPKPVVLAVHGYCIGVAAQIAAFCDIVLVADDARIVEPTIPIGGGFIAPTWVSETGGHRAKEFAFLPGNAIDGATAARWGWANAAVAADGLIACAEDLAARMATVPPGVLAGKKRSINRAMEAAGFTGAMSALAESDALLHAEPEVQEIRRELAEKGLKPTVARFAGESSRAIIARYSR